MAKMCILFTWILLLGAVLIFVAGLSPISGGHWLWVYSFAFLPSFIATEMFVVVSGVPFGLLAAAFLAQGVVLYWLLGWLLDKTVVQRQRGIHGAIMLAVGAVILLELGCVNLYRDPRSGLFPEDPPSLLTLPSALWAVVATGLMYLGGRCSGVSLWLRRALRRGRRRVGEDQERQGPPGDRGHP